MPSNHLILGHPLLLQPSIFPSIRVFSNESVLLIRWPKYWSFSFNISPSNEYPGLISFRIDFSNTTVQKHQVFGTQLSLQSNSHIHTWLLENHSLDQTHDKDNAKRGKLIDLVPQNLQACNSTDIRRIYSTSPIKITIDQNKLLPNIHQFPLGQKVIEGIKPLISVYINKGLIIPCTSPCNILILPVKKSNGKGWRFVQDLRSINAINPTPYYPIFLKIVTSFQ